MIEEEEQRGHEAAAMLYDYFKHLTSLCLFSLGGVLALAEKVQGRSGLLIGALAVIGLAALVSFASSGEIVAARLKGTPLSNSLNLYRFVSPALLSVGLGMFLYLFLGTLK